MPLYKIVNGVRIEMTPQEEAEFEASRAPSLATLKADLLGKIAARRIAIEEGGVTVANRRVSTTREARQQLRDVREWAQDNPGQLVPMRLATGRVVRVAAPALAVAAAAVAGHVRSCIEAEGAHIDAIDALPDVQSAQTYDITTGWPA